VARKVNVRSAAPKNPYTAEGLGLMPDNIRLAYISVAQLMNGDSDQPPVRRRIQRVLPMVLEKTSA
jgi:hypothetical protein